MINDQEIGWNLENSYAQLPELFFTQLKPTTVQAPKLIVFNAELAATLGFHDEMLQKEEGVALLAGNELPPNSESLAQTYAGHQFGNFTRLGDGRAILLGEQITPRGERVDIQLKGAGRTPYSRGGDGRAALGPMLREYIISEAMHALHIPTTRSLAVVTTGETILREKELASAILTRTAASHLRVGTFQYAAAWGTKEELQALADYAIERHYPEAAKSDNPYKQLLKEVIEHQASLIAKWQLIGFIHGVMNTDNMTISGETIDYGPCAFMGTYDSSTVFSSIDQMGRYKYENQPAIGGWNLARFAETLLPLLHHEGEQAVKIAQDLIATYDERFYFYWLAGMRSKLGLTNEESDDAKIVTDLLDLMQTHEADFTNTFLALTHDKWEDCKLHNSQEFKQWHDRWLKRKSRQEVSENEIKQVMKNSNPAVIPRNHRVEEALEAAVEAGDYRVMKQFMDVLSSPYDHTPDKVPYQTVPDNNTPYRTFCGT
ncbi:protein adenylyltransferase SelO [Virgibacillus sp. W0181]|uniref:protein adenylyltransferase SelO n=1 Tax=Virgibacillus sp. W0181 TaxID=3391581 RepID=UPI003F479A28